MRHIMRWRKSTRRFCPATTHFLVSFPVLLLAIFWAIEARIRCLCSFALCALFRCRWTTNCTNWVRTQWNIRDWERWMEPYIAFISATTIVFVRFPMLFLAVFRAIEAGTLLLRSLATGALFFCHHPAQNTKWHRWRQNNAWQVGTLSTRVNGEMACVTIHYLVMSMFIVPYSVPVGLDTYIGMYPIDITSWTEQWVLRPKRPVSWKWLDRSTSIDLEILIHKFFGCRAAAIFNKFSEVWK